jgi:subtilase family serine protease
MTHLKDTKINLKINNVLTWPRLFKEGDRVTTSFKVENKGNASASGINVVLYINGKEKNKVQDILIPAGGYADVKMPWIAVKGKNEINIVVE